MRHYDLSPLYRSFVGLDRMASLIETATQSAASQNSYPPYNVAQLSENDYRIELAVAGFSEDELTLESHENVLTLTGQKASSEAENQADNDSLNYLHQGIAQRGFERRFQLADHIRVTDAALKNGLLVITLKRELPEALKPRRICLLYTSPSPRDATLSRMPSSA